MQQKTVRGVSWVNYQRDARCAHRNWIAPINFYNNLGFRLVRSK